MDINLYIKINSKGTINLNVKSKTLKLLKENKREKNLCSLCMDRVS